MLKIFYPDNKRNRSVAPQNSKLRAKFHLKCSHLFNFNEV